MRFGYLQSISNSIDIRFWCLNTFGGLFLKAMQNIHRIDEFDRINSTISVTMKVFYNFNNDCRAKPLQRLGRILPTAGLCKMQCKTKNVLHIIWHFQ